MKSTIFLTVTLFIVGAYLYGSVESLWGVPMVLVSAGIALRISWSLPTSDPKYDSRTEARTREMNTRENPYGGEAAARGA